MILRTCISVYGTETFKEKGTRTDFDEYREGILHGFANGHSLHDISDDEFVVKFPVLDETTTEIVRLIED